uniref:Uncharacterized protein n=1 Tax=Avena sativa TaxID=4498 RepID=A0ACD5Y531_AVESA
MYVLAMELVRLSDTSAEAYDKLVSLFKNNLVEMAPFENARDGLGLEDRVAEGARKRQDNTTDVFADITLEDGGDVENLAGLSAPAKRMKKGKPNSSRDKAPYEGAGRRLNFAAYARSLGINGRHALIEATWQSNREGRGDAAGVLLVGIEKAHV